MKLSGRAFASVLAASAAIAIAAWDHFHSDSRGVTTHHSTENSEDIVKYWTNQRIDDAEPMPLRDR